MEAILVVENLKKKYNKNEPYILKGINFKVYPGDIIGYIGPNGAGKSTTIKSILGIIDDYEGSITIHGKDIKKGSNDYKRKIGYVSESGEVYEMLTGAEYITFLSEIYKIDPEIGTQKGRALMGIFDIEEYYDTQIAAYSKGMKQKLLIIAALFHDPDIIFFDEPLNGMDANSIMIFKEILKQLSLRNKTIFYSSHIMEVVQKISNRILLVQEGQIAADSTFEQLKNKNLEDSLENIFNKMTGFSEHEALAEQFVEIVNTRDTYAV